MTRNYWILTVLLLVGAVAAGIYVVGQRNVTLKFSENDLRARLEDQLPFSRDYLFVFNVTLDNPRIDLVDGSDRIAGGMDVILNVRLGGQEMPLGGGLDMSGGLRYAPETGEFFLDSPRVENVRVQGLPNSLANQANQALSLALAEFYEERPVYRLSDEDAKQAAARFILRDVEVKDETLFVTLGLNKSGVNESSM